MTLGNCVFFPQQLLPLRIFEPRYRLMLQEALAGDRLFAVSLLDEDQLSEANPEPPCPITCIGRIIHHAMQPDGTSQIILEGLRRARVKKVERQLPYPRLEITSVFEPEVADPASCLRPIVRIINYCEKFLEPLGEQGADLREKIRGLVNQPSGLADVAAGHFISDIELRRELLECLAPDKRLLKVAEALDQLHLRRKMDDFGTPDSGIGLN
jgi:Lon protease-like protein